MEEQDITRMAYLYFTAKESTVRAMVASGTHVYEGDWRNDRQHSEGKEYNIDGSNRSICYESYFENDEPVKKVSATSFQKNSVDLNAPLTELNSLIGLERVKQQIQSLTHVISLQNERKRRNPPTIAMTYHMVFTGNPGTGKTTVDGACNILRNSNRNFDFEELRKRLLYSPVRTQAIG